MRCDCCGGTFVDEVALLAIEDGVTTFAKGLLDRADEWEAALADAEQAIAEALGELG